MSMYGIHAVQDRLRAGEVFLGWKTSPASASPVGFYRPPPPPREEPLFAPDESHLITVAPNGAGKGRSALIPTLLSYPGTCVVIDPKGEALAVTHRHRQSLGPVVVFDPFGVSPGPHDSFNPFDALACVPGGVEVAAQEVKDSIMGSRKQSLKDPFWDDKAGALLAGLITYAIDSAPPKHRNLAKVYDLLHSDDATYALAVLLDTTKNLSPAAHGAIASSLNTADNTRSGIFSTAQRYMDIFAPPEVRRAVHTTSFDMDGFAAGETMTIYMVLPPTKLTSFGPLMRLWLSALFGLILHGRKAQPEIATLMLIDEAAQLGTMDILRQAMTLFRFKGIRAWTFWQDLSQLKTLYPSDWESILNNARVTQTFGITTYQMAKTMAQVMHEKKLSPEDLLGLKHKEQALLFPRGNVVTARRPDYLRDEIYAGLYDINPNYGTARARD